MHLYNKLYVYNIFFVGNSVKTLIKNILYFFVPFSHRDAYGSLDTNGTQKSRLLFLCLNSKPVSNLRSQCEFYEVSYWWIRCAFLLSPAHSRQARILSQRKRMPVLFFGSVIKYTLLCNLIAQDVKFKDTSNCIIKFNPI